MKHKQILKWGYFNADHIIVLADEFKQKLEAQGYGKKITVSFNPIEDSHKGTVLNDIVNSCGISFMARIERSKGIFEALDCFKIFEERHPELIFNVAGDGPVRAEAEEYVKNQGIQDVVFHGFVNGEVKRQLLNNNMLLLLLSSHKEANIEFDATYYAGIIPFFFSTELQEEY